MRKWRRRAISTAQKEVVTFGGIASAPGARCSFSDGCNQCSDAKGWVLDAGARLWLLCSRAFALPQRSRRWRLGRAYTLRCWHRLVAR